MQIPEFKRVPYSFKTPHGQDITYLQGERAIITRTSGVRVKGTSLVQWHGMMGHQGQLQRFADMMSDRYGYNGRILSFPGHEFLISQVDQTDPNIDFKWAVGQLGLEHYLDFIVGQVREEYETRNQPVAILGHSMGGLLAILFLNAYHNLDTFWKIRSGRDSAFAEVKQRIYANLAYLREHDVLRAAFPLEPGSPKGVFNFTLWGSAFFGPLVFTKGLFKRAFTLGPLRSRLLLLNGFPRPLKDQITQKLSYDSGRALWQMSFPGSEDDLLELNLPATFDTPCCIIGGTHDRVVTQKSLRRIQSMIPGSSLVWVPKGNHWIIDGSQMEITASHVNTFLSSLPN